jgi:hypothetical protein
MTYHKPEVLPLGLATLLIEGGKSAQMESEQPLKPRTVPDSELDD